MPKGLNHSIILLILLNAIMVVSNVEISVASQSNSKNFIQNPYFKSSSISESINITDNSDFINQTHFNGWSGNGSQTNPIVITNLQIKTSSNFGISIQNSDLFFVISNCYLIVYANDFYHGLDAGISLENVQHGTLINNMISSGNIIGINIISSSNLTIKDNTVENNDYGAFVLTNSSNNLLMNNTGFQNDDSSFQFVEGSNNNTVINNLVTNLKTGFGFYIENSNYNLFFHNQVDYSSDLAFSIYGSLQFPIYNNFSYNNFINNDKFNLQHNVSYQKQAWCDGITNIIDHNYWSDLTGPDQNGDGIVDVPYTTLGSGVNDSNPVTKPYLLTFYVSQLTFSSDYASTSLDQSSSTFGIIILVTVFIIAGIVFGGILLSRNLLKHGNEFSTNNQTIVQNSFNEKIHFPKQNLEQFPEQDLVQRIKVTPSCPHCCEPLPKGELFCKNCGNRI